MVAAVGSNQTPSANTSALFFNAATGQLTTTSTKALYADLAEMYVADAPYNPGTVLIFGGNQEVTISTVSHDNKVAGVVSTIPAHVMNSGLQGEFTIELAMDYHTVYCPMKCAVLTSKFLI
jgi:hypothetical protein